MSQRSAGVVRAGLTTVALLVVALGAPAPADAQTPDAETRAQELYAEGNQHFDLAEYEQAIVKFKEAYRLLEEPLFLYNIAQAYRQMGACSDARALYRTYLRKAPDSDIRAKVEKRIVEMEACIKEKGGEAVVEKVDEFGTETETGTETGTETETETETETGTETETATATATETETGTETETETGTETGTGTGIEGAPGRTKRIAGIATAGVGVALMVTGGYFSTQASDADARIEELCAVSCAASDVESIDADGERAQRNAAILYTVGGVAIAAGVAVYVWGHLDGREQHVALVPSTSGAMVVGAWAF